MNSDKQLKLPLDYPPESKADRCLRVLAGGLGGQRAAARTFTEQTARRAGVIARAARHLTYNPVPTTSLTLENKHRTAPSRANVTQNVT